MPKNDDCQNTKCVTWLYYLVEIVVFDGIIYFFAQKYIILPSGC